MIALEQRLQDLHIAEEETPIGRQWHSLTVDEIEEIKRLFITAGFKPPTSLGEMVVERIIYDRIAALLSSYNGPWNIPGVLQVVALACEVEND